MTFFGPIYSKFIFFSKFVWDRGVAPQSFVFLVLGGASPLVSRQVGFFANIPHFYEVYKSNKIKSDFWGGGGDQSGILAALAFY